MSLMGFLEKMKDQSPSPNSNFTPESPGLNATTPPLGRRKMLKALSASALSITGGSLVYYYQQPRILPLYFDGVYAQARPEHPALIHAVVRFCNEIQGKPYVRGGGHQVLFDEAFDCSGSISHVLFRAGLLDRPLTSSGFASYGLPGPGRFLSIFVKPGNHVFMSVCGLRYDTTDKKSSPGPAWRAQPRSPNGFINRHPSGL
jgi:hypothetical protein